MTDRPVLPPQPWLNAAATRRLVAALAGDGTAIRFVGGCVRDALLGRPSSDIDLATPDPPDVVMAKLRRAGLRAVPTGLAHGTVTALVDDARYEVTTLRRDVATDGRRAQVAFTDDWREDAARRDFTINALSAAPDGVVHDYFNGIDDLAAGRVVFVGEPATRIAEDYLRVLRFYRFQAWYGRGAPDARARAACRAAASSLTRLSGERVRAELLKLLAAPDPAGAMACMIEDGVVEGLSLGLCDVEALAALVRLERPGDGVPLRRLGALVASEATDAVASLAERLRLSNAERERLVAMRAARLRLPRDGTRPAMLRRALYRLGLETLCDSLLLSAARGTGDAASLADDLDAVGSAVLPRFPISGADVLARGVAPGPQVGRTLAAVEDWWIDTDFRADRRACLERLAEAIVP